MQSLRRDLLSHGKVLCRDSTLKNGYIWRVENDQSINIWDDTWIPNCATKKVITPKGGHLLSKVSDLIDPTSNNWDDDLVNQTLWPIDAHRILAIPLPQYDMTDFIAWNYTKNGIFSVRSAYVVEWNHQYGRKLSRSNGLGQTNFNPIWHKIWNLSCPAKVKKFIWRALHGTLPCRVTLVNRHMKVSSICLSCSFG